MDNIKYNELVQFFFCLPDNIPIVFLSGKISKSKPGKNKKKMAIYLEAFRIERYLERIENLIFNSLLIIEKFFISIYILFFLFLIVFWF